MSLMSSLVKIGKGAIKYCNAHSSGILTVAGMIGVVAVSIVSAECMKAAREAEKEAEEEK